MRKVREWISVQLAKNPGGMVLAVILLFNILFFLGAAVIISGFSLAGTENMSFLQAAICTITMILDAGCIQFVIADIGQASVNVAITCLVIIIIGMISFTGAVIGYITNYISSFIEHSNAGDRKLYISGHTVILNWNTRASEILNDLLYCRTRQKVVVLVESGKAAIEKEIAERLGDTIARENEVIDEKYCRLPYFIYRRNYHGEKLWRNVNVIVREGDVYSAKQLHDISLEHAKAVIILGSDLNGSSCRYETVERSELRDRGNSLTVKTLMLVADITSASDSDDNQKIIVEITDEWTSTLVDKIILYKQVRAKCNIIPVRVNQILGQILSQFSLMPELNLVYKELFSNKGAAFFTEPYPVIEGVDFVTKYLEEHRHAIPLNHMESGGLQYHYFVAASEQDVHTEGAAAETGYTVQLNENYWLENKNVIILGHNSKSGDIMRGFASFRSEWMRPDGGEIVNIVVVDDEESLKKMGYYSQYPFVTATVAADIYDKELICQTIEHYVSLSKEDTSILILSDDNAPSEEIDSHALANLVYVQDIVNKKKTEDPNFDVNSMDIIVEIIDPKHYDVVNSYSVHNVVISNRYISKMITQIGEKEALFDFYADILTYDEDTSGGYESMEVYAKKVSQYFAVTPEKTTAAQFIRAVYRASADPSLPREKRNPTVALGYVKASGELVLFEGDQEQTMVELAPEDKIIVFSSH